MIRLFASLLLVAQSNQESSPKGEKRIGVLATLARPLGGLDLQTFAKTEPWMLFRELAKRYEFVDVPPENDYPNDLDLLIAILPSSLKQEELDRFSRYVEEGKPTLILDDPAPAFNPSLGASRPLPQRPMFGPPPDPKGDFRKASRRFGVDWEADRVVWQKYNPYSAWKDLPPEILFVRKGVGDTFEPKAACLAGLREVVFMYAGCVRPVERPGLDFFPLLRTVENSGAEKVEQVFGGNVEVERKRTSEKYLLGTKVQGEYVDEEKRAVKIRLVLIADADVISDSVVRGMGLEVVDGRYFDNVAFAENLIQELTGSPVDSANPRRQAAFRGAKDASIHKVAVSQLQAVSTALACFESDNGFLPTQEQGLKALLEKPRGKPVPANWVRYLPGESVLVDPWGNGIVYRRSDPGSSTRFELRSNGPDGKEGTEDDLVFSE